MWNQAKRGYNATKKEYKGVFKALQKLQFQLYNIYFILKIDANTLIAQLNRAAINLFKALVTRQLAQIRLFDFEVCYIKGKKHIIADGLSQRPYYKEDSEDNLDIDKFITLKLNVIGI